jgi:hypothetical protein
VKKSSKLESRKLTAIKADTVFLNIFSPAREIGLPELHQLLDGQTLS